MGKQLPILFNIKNTLGPLEYDVFNVLCDKNRSTVRKIVEDLHKTRPLAYTTVMTVMNNLYKKGFVNREKIKKTYQYYPVVRKEILIHSAIRKTIKNIAIEYGIRTSILSLIYIPVFNRPILKYNTPAMTGFSFTMFFSLFLFSIWDLIHNLQLLGTIDYLKLMIYEPNILRAEASLAVTAFLENVPTINLMISLALLVPTVFAAKKMAKLLEFTTPIIFKL